MWKLINIADSRELKVGDKVETFRGEKVTLIGLRPPHKPASSGHVTVKFRSSAYDAEFYPSVIGARFLKSGNI
jgi:hypothetical protein